MTPRYTFIRFLMVGCINTIIGLSAIYMFLHVFHFEYWVSTFIGNSIGATVSYFLNRHFTFQSEVSMLSSIPRFIIVILFCYGFSYKIGLTFAETVLSEIELFNGYEEDFAVLIGAAFYTVTNYFGQRIFVFRPVQFRQGERRYHE